MELIELQNGVTLDEVKSKTEADFTISLLLKLKRKVEEINKIIKMRLDGFHSQTGERKPSIFWGIPFYNEERQGLFTTVINTWQTVGGKGADF